MSAEALLEWRSFVTQDRAWCMWGFDLPHQNDDFLSSLDPQYFKHAVEAQLPFLNTPQAPTASLVIRTVYAHGLETLFALLCAAVQAPHCPIGWILKYRPGDVPRVVRGIHEGTPILARLSFADRWMGLSQRIHLFSHADAAEDLRIKTLFGEVWENLAEDFLDDLGGVEYNSIKHGLRSKPAPLSLRIDRIDDPNAPPILDSKSEFGSHFFTTTSIGGDSVNFFARRAGRSWSPIALAIRTELIALSLANVVSFLRVKSGKPGASVNFVWPEPGNDIAAAWASPGTIRSFVGGDEIDVAAADLITKEQIVSFYADGPDT